MADWRPAHLQVPVLPPDREAVGKFVAHIRQHLYALEMSLTVQEVAEELRCVMADTAGMMGETVQVMQMRIAADAMNN